MPEETDTKKRVEAPGLLVGLMIHDATNGKELVRKAIKFPLTEAKYKEMMDHQSLLTSLAKGLLNLAGQALDRFAKTSLEQLKAEAIKAMQEAQKGQTSNEKIREAIMKTKVGPIPANIKEMLNVKH